MTGYIKLHRKIINWEWYKDIPTKTVFFHLILKANYKDSLFNEAIVKRGELALSEQTIANQTGLTRAMVRRALKNLVQSQEITRFKTKKKPIISITKYEDYQKIDPKVEASLTQKKASYKEIYNKYKKLNNSEKLSLNNNFSELLNEFE